MSSIRKIMESNSATQSEQVSEKVIDTLRLRVIDAVRHEKREALKDPVNHQPYLESVAMIQAKGLTEDIPAGAFKEVVNDLLGYGPLNNLLTGKINEVIAASFSEVFYEQNGFLKKADIKFRSEKHFQAILNKIAMTVGRRIDRNCPTIDAKLPDGTRVMMSIPPLSVRGASANFRRFPTFYSLNELVDMNVFTPESFNYISEIQKNGFNITITGAMGAGKTTVLNALVDALAVNVYPYVVVVIYEDTIELSPKLSCVRQYESLQKNIDGQGGMDLEELVQKHLLRTRADWIVLGEMRGRETFYVLSAMVLGNNVMSTFHSYDVHEAVERRLPKLYMMNPQSSAIGLPAVVDEISYAVDVVVHVAKLIKPNNDGQIVERKVVQIGEVLQRANPLTGYMVPDINIVFEWDGKKLSQVSDSKLHTKKRRWF